MVQIGSICYAMSPGNLHGVLSILGHPVNIVCRSMPCPNSPSHWKHQKRRAGEVTWVTSDGPDQSGARGHQGHGAPWVCDPGRHTMVTSPAPRRILVIGRRISAPESAHRLAGRHDSSLAAAGILISAVNRIVGVSWESLEEIVVRYPVSLLFQIGHWPPRLARSGDLRSD